MSVLITQKEFDRVCDSLEAASYRCGNWLPTMEEIKENLEPNIERDLIFALWILETGNPPQTQEGKRIRRYLMSLINDTIEIIDEGPDGDLTEQKGDNA